MLTSLHPVLTVLHARWPRCPACGQRIRPGARTLRVQGSRLHRDCAVYRRRRRGAGSGLGPSLRVP